MDPSLDTTEGGQELGKGLTLTERGNRIELQLSAGYRDRYSDTTPKHL